MATTSRPLIEIPIEGKPLNWESKGWSTLAPATDDGTIDTGFDYIPPDVLEPDLADVAEAPPEEAGSGEAPAPENTGKGLFKKRKVPKAAASKQVARKVR